MQKKKWRNYSKSRKFSVVKYANRKIAKLDLAKFSRYEVFLFSSYVTCTFTFALKIVVVAYRWS